jgi:cobalt-zinc-cadmium efflux system outer membrane protein
MALKRPPFLAALAAFIIVSALPAQEEGLTLDKAVELALAGHPEVREALARVEVARGRTLQLAARPEPELTAGLEGIPLPGLKEEGDMLEVRLGIEQIFEYPGKRSLRIDIGRKGEELAGVELDRVRLLLAARVKRSYWRVVFAAGAVTAIERSGARLDSLLEDLESKYRTGSAAYGDVLRARAEMARLKNQALDQARERRMAELELGGLLGLSAGDPVELTTPLPFAPLEADPSALWERARTTLPSMRAAALRVDRTASAVKLAGLGRRPDFLAGFLLPSVRPNAWGVEFGLTLPFLRPGRARGQALEAGAEAEASRLAAEGLSRRVRTAVESAYAAARSAEGQVLVYERSLLAELEDELAIELEYFRYGKVQAFGVIDLHRTFVQAQVEHLRALLLYNLALADLEVAGEEIE